MSMDESKTPMRELGTQKEGTPRACSTVDNYRPGIEEAGLHGVEGIKGSIAPKKRKPFGFYLAFIGLSFNVFVFSLDATTLAVAIPSIAHQLHGTTLESFWGSIAYLLGVVITQPLYASISDVFGRKPPYYVAMLLFLIGSVVFALAPNMVAIIAARVLQGLGGGGLNVLADIIITDMTTLQERSRYYSLLAFPIALGTVLGPTIGALFSDYADWRWIGWMNLPFLAIAFPLVYVFLRLRPLDAALQSRVSKFDWVGMSLFTVGAAAFVIPLSWAGSLYAWGAWQTLLPLLLGAAVLAFFAIYERRPEAPIIPPRLFQSRTAVMTLIGATVHGLTLYPLLQYLPFFFQAVSLESPIQSAVTMLPTSIISCVSAGAATAALSDRWGGYRSRVRMCWVLSTLGSGLLALLDSESSASTRLGTPIVWGAGIGGLLQLLLLPLQASVQNADDVGLAIGVLVTVRILGGVVGVAIGATVFSSVFAASIANVRYLPGSLAVLKQADQAIGFIPTLRTLDVPADVLAPVLGAYLDAMRAVFYTMTGFGVIGILSSVFTEALTIEKTDLGAQRFEE
ncbi:MFS general substrate transporter [Astrocystis sublimbata]|nr:MFS general substrate transporter [Astrocystis sublimbata]